MQIQSNIEEQLNVSSQFKRKIQERYVKEVIPNSLKQISECLPQQYKYFLLYNHIDPQNVKSDSDLTKHQYVIQQNIPITFSVRPTEKWQGRFVFRERKIYLNIQFQQTEEKSIDILYHEFQHQIEYLSVRQQFDYPKEEDREILIQKQKDGSWSELEFGKFKFNQNDKNKHSYLWQEISQCINKFFNRQVITTFSDIQLTEDIPLQGTQFLVIIGIHQLIFNSLQLIPKFIIFHFDKIKEKLQKESINYEIVIIPIPESVQTVMRTFSSKKQKLTYVQTQIPKEIDFNTSPIDYINLQGIKQYNNTLYEIVKTILTLCYGNYGFQLILDPKNDEFSFVDNTQEQIKRLKNLIPDYGEMLQKYQPKIEQFQQEINKNLLKKSIYNISKMGTIFQIEVDQVEYKVLKQYTYNLEVFPKTTNKVTIYEKQPEVKKSIEKLYKDFLQNYRYDQKRYFIVIEDYITKDPELITFLMENMSEEEKMNLTQSGYTEWNNPKFFEQMLYLKNDKQHKLVKQGFDYLYKDVIPEFVGLGGIPKNVSTTIQTPWGNIRVMVLRTI